MTTPRRYTARSKYGAVPTVVDGIRFDSKKEARRYQELRLLEKAREIEDLTLQPIFSLKASLGTVGEYRGDFCYTDLRTGLRVVEDVKGVDTPLSKWKRRHVKAQYGIEVQLV